MRKIATTETWPADEVSTRNCSNCHMTPPPMPTPRPAVHCAAGHKLSRQYQGVVLHDRLFQECVGCPDIDNNWQVN